MAHIRDRAQPGTACPVDGVERGGRGNADVVHGHAARLGAAELREHDADADILDERRVEVWVGGERGAEDRGEELLGVAVFEPAFEGACYGCAERREDDDV